MRKIIKIQEIQDPTKNIGNIGNTFKPEHFVWVNIASNKYKADITREAIAIQQWPRSDDHLPHIYGNTKLANDISAAYTQICGNTEANLYLRQ